MIKKQCPVPKSPNFEQGGYHCENHKCINGNKPYSDFQTAWKKCGEIDECDRIMRVVNGKFYLRRFYDTFEQNDRLEFVDYHCKGKIINIFNFLFPSILKELLSILKI